MTGKKTPAALLIMAVIILANIQAAEPFSSADDEEFLNKLEHDAFLYFLKESDPQTGLTKDSSRPGSPSSSAAVGFGIAAMCIGESKGWISRKDAEDRILKVLYRFKYGVGQEHGFFYRFLNAENGDRFLDSEISAVDTAYFIAGALFAGEYFKGTEVEKAAKELYERVDWPWMMNGKDSICKGWKPEYGFLSDYWDSYSEAMILYALAIGSPTHPIPASAWFGWKRRVDSYKDNEVISSDSGSLYTYQYSHAWIDFRKLFEGKTNYFDNSVSAVKANRQFCSDNSAEYKTYGENTWGLTACIGPDGYRNYGAKPGEAYNDGTIAPSGMAGSVVFQGELSIKGLRSLFDKYGKFLYGEYGFKNAFNLDQDWYSEEYLGADIGISIIMIENYRTEMVWQKFMAIAPIQRWAAACFSKE